MIASISGRNNGVGQSSGACGTALKSCFGEASTLDTRIMCPQRGISDNALRSDY